MQLNENALSILNSISDGIVIIDRDYTVAFANTAMLSLCKSLHENDVIGRKCHELSHQCPTPCFENCLSGIVCPHVEVFTTGKKVSVSHRHRISDNSYVDLDITASALRNSDGDIVRMIEVVRDVTDRELAKTERRQTEEALIKSEIFMNNILESVDEGFVVIDRNFRIISANRSFCRQVKCCTEDVLEKYCYEVSHHLSRPCFLEGEECAPYHTFRTGLPYVAIHTHIDSEGFPVYVETKSFPIKDETGNVVSAIETLNNITEQRRLEEQLRHAQKMEAIGTLAGGIAHDFNNMLNIIIGYGGLMQMKMKDDEPLMYHLKEILKAGEKAAQLTRGLLAFSRKQVMDLKSISINRIIEGFQKMLSRIIGEDINLTLSLSDQALSVRADSGQLEQVLMNLAANARDAMPKGGILTIETGQAQIDQQFILSHGYGEAGTYVLLSVSDTGAGMDEMTRERIFEPYFTTKEMGRGTGLGLSIVYGIVKQHRGYIDCYSEAGSGTTFNIYLPLAESEAKAEEAEAAALPQGGSETILIAEDDIGVRNLMRSLLETYGYKIIEAVDGKDAVNKFREHEDSINLLIFDVIMPAMSGKEAYDEIRRMNRRVKAIFMSGYAADFIKGRGALEDNMEFISKPISTTGLMQKVREMLNR